MKDLLEKALDETGLQETGADDGYVSSILAPEALGGYWLSEMDNGANSGWMYTVNGKHPDQALNDFTLEAGDKVIWHYVDDYTTEADAETWLKAADISPEDYAKQKLAKIVRVSGRGTVEPRLDFFAAWDGCDVHICSGRKPEAPRRVGRRQVMGTPERCHV